jgi:hypothetical protein
MFYRSLGNLRVGPPPVSSRTNVRKNGLFEAELIRTPMRSKLYFRTLPEDFGVWAIWIGSCGSLVLSGFGVASSLRLLFDNSIVFFSFLTLA